MPFHGLPRYAEQIDDRIRTIANKEYGNNRSVAISVRYLVEEGSHLTATGSGCSETPLDHTLVPDETLSLIAKSLTELPGFIKKGISVRYDSLSRRFTVSYEKRGA